RASGVLILERSDRVPYTRLPYGGTGSSNPLRSSRESGEIVGSATLAGRGRCFTAPRLFIWGLSISRARCRRGPAMCLRTHLGAAPPWIKGVVAPLDLGDCPHNPL